MKLCLVGIGGCGGNVLAEFLDDQDLSIREMSSLTGGQHTAIGGIRGLWLEADVNAARNKQDFFGDLSSGSYPGYLIPHDFVPSGSPLHVAVREKYGYDVKKQGFFREAQYLKAIFEIFEGDEEIRRISREDQGSPNPILEKTWSTIRPFTTLGKGVCDGILFIVSLGGGTGTGFINPILRYIRAEGQGDYPVFVLGVLTEKGIDQEQQSKEKQRDLGAAISIYDLVTKRTGLGGDSVDGLILVDNQILMDRFKGDYTAINRYLFETMTPLIAGRSYPGENPPSLPLRQHFTDGLSRPPILVPCYHRRAKKADQEEELVTEALAEGQLILCDPAKADRAYLFSRGYLDSEEMIGAVSRSTGLEAGKILSWRKLGDNKHDEILILLRNPYGDPQAYKTHGTMEHRLYDVIKNALEYLEENQEKLTGEAVDHSEEVESQSLTAITRNALKSYFFGEGRLKMKLLEGLARIERGERPIFREELRIFGKVDQKNNQGVTADGVITEGERKLIEEIVKEEVRKLLSKRAG